MARPSKEVDNGRDRNTPASRYNKLEGCTIKKAITLMNEAYPGLILVVTHPAAEGDVYVKFVAMNAMSMMNQGNSGVLVKADPILGVKSLEDKEVKVYEELDSQ